MFEEYGRTTDDGACLYYKPKSSGELKAMYHHSDCAAIICICKLHDQDYEHVPVYVTLELCALRVHKHYIR